MGDLSLLYYDLNKIPTQGLAGGQYNAYEAYPNQGLIDVTRMAWRNNKTGNIDEVPSILLTEYKLTTAQWLSNLSRLLLDITGSTNSSDSNSKDPYETLYFGEPTGFTYNLPYIINNASIRGELNNDWQSVFSATRNSIVGKAIATAQTAGGIVSPGSGVEDVKLYNKTQFKSINLSFPLYNTLDITSTLQNFSFVTLFEFQNLKTRTSYNTFTPPKIYVVEPVGVGGIYMPAAYISKFDVKSIGTVRKIQELDASFGKSTYGGALIPEAYKVEITITELIAQSTNIMAGALGENKVSVIGNLGNTGTTPQRGTIPSTTGGAPKPK
jgi:hypothetical protein